LCTLCRLQELKLLHNHSISDLLLFLTVTLLFLHMRRFRLTAKRFIIENHVEHILLLHSGTYAWFTQLQEPLRYVEVFRSFVERNSKEKLHVLETVLTVWGIHVKGFKLLHKMEKVQVMVFCALSTNRTFWISSVKFNGQKYVYENRNAGKKRQLFCLILLENDLAHYTF
jgi:hypothetical protein